MPNTACRLGHSISTVSKGGVGSGASGAHDDVCARLVREPLDYWPYLTVWTHLVEDLRSWHIRLFDLKAGCRSRHKSLNGCGGRQCDPNIEPSIRRVLMTAKGHCGGGKAKPSQLRLAEQADENSKIIVNEISNVLRSYFEHRNQR